MKHVFITGCPRSGTTMLANILGNGESCVATPESHFFNDFIYKYLPENSSKSEKKDLVIFFNDHYRFKQWEIDANNIENLPKIITNKSYNIVIENTIKLFAERHSKSQEKELIRIDHTPSNIKSFNIINKLFPGSKFVFIVRDPRAVYASIKDLDWGPNSSLKLSQLWIEYTAAFFAVQRLYPNRVCLIKYEDIIKTPSTQVKKLCDFIEIEYRNSLLEEGSGFKVPDYTFSQHALVGKALDKSRINKWKNELQKQDIKIIESQCDAILNALGYENLFDSKYKITKRDKLKELFKEIYYYFPNKIRKKNRESKL
ncbi:sulfotransferase family protein [Psychroflexus salinarum]|uniref:Sulfotransferase family protein n=1 Tax=Psychroflexus salinarum TaxID=546024 RepID=A0ABW3GN99_9FLAO